MARVHGKDITLCNVDDSAGTPRDLLSETKQINFKLSAKTHDTTTIGDDWFESTAGLKGGDTFTHSCMYNDASNQTASVYDGRLGVQGTFQFGDGTRSKSMETIVTEVSDPVDVGEMRMITATHQITGAVTQTP